ncbi:MULTISPECIES: hypothetical protein [unclassified Bradyrhizobium]|uniref:hypothetical protein n=1 Tax=unclassified Bradyrhizobium TaxID=2631580 RepID=UPI001BAD3CF7|nr:MULTISPECIES: hypothetical protein [unclassified Bradyrhizobium]MBR1206627.1 hypothetical protein [Bradyrhizobium sp. AUGA SZCCT0124]MBR1315395.1 hypothetical protein [Bradyrhizobium sp. AUGA SZCCT0051]MBR1338543.1 hypothetical protein [Bradyrhizobium sp. AUGA SZCCT0105]MBR1356198.1 hypothetical protein [Bradyrhizobium sp. AUGA SZCCT0045]
MLGDLFWNVATSYFALGLDGLVFVVAFVIGHFPLLRYSAQLAPYVNVARLVSVLVAALLFFMIGFRVSDEREEAKSLRATLAARDLDLENSRKSLDYETARAGAIAEGAQAQHEADVEYIRQLEGNDACKFDPFGGVRDGSARGSSAAAGSGAGSPAGAR